MRRRWRSMIRPFRAGGGVLAFACGTACADGSSTVQPPPPPADSTVNVRFVDVIGGLSAPSDLTAPAADARLFVAEQPGRIRIIRNGQLLATPFLDITAKVGYGGERGLLGIAFHPQYAANGHVFVSYTDRQGTSIIERYRVSADPDRADAESALLILSVPQPFSNHNGGQITFGPDGMLYIGLGDGGGGGDPGAHGQNPHTLLGALLRLDVDGGTPYRIPPDNPFATGGGRPEIWATGLRNPWRFSFDRPSGLLYIADVGQNRREEINVQPGTSAGLNYGWNRMEGMECYPAGSSCNPAGLTLPVLDYPNPADGCSVTGGYVYRGALLPALRGRYFYADYCRGWVRSFRYGTDGRATDARQMAAGLGNIMSFGVDAAGELYVLLSAGRILRMEP